MSTNLGTNTAHLRGYVGRVSKICFPAVYSHAVWTLLGSPHPAKLSRSATRFLRKKASSPNNFRHYG